jgi:signal peptidase I
MPDLRAEVSKQSWPAMLFSFRGRLNRTGFLKWWIAISIANVVLLLVSFLLLFWIADAVRSGQVGQSSGPALSWLIAIAYAVLLFWMSFALQAKRFHDIGVRGWWSLLGAVPYLGALMILYLVFAAGKRDANRYGAAPLPPSNKAVTASIVAVGFVAVGLLIFGGRSFIAEPFSVGSLSNAPTLLTRDVVMVSRYSRPQRGDMVFFKNPHTGEDYVKRLVGLPGDTVQMRRGVLVVNGTPWQRERQGTQLTRHFDEMYDRVVAEIRYLYVETAPNGSKHEILGAPTGQREDSMPYDDTEIFTVPEGHFFAIGDNRDNSRDSRMDLGYVPLANLIGKAEFCLFSAERANPFLGIWGQLSSARWGRMFMAIR